MPLLLLPCRHRLTSVLLALMLASPAGAATWYRVELLIFTQGGAAAQQAERWNPEPELAYPERYRFLVDPQQVAGLEATYPEAERVQQANGVQVVTLPAPVTELPPAQDIPTREPVIDEDAAADPNTPAPAPEAPDEDALRLPEPFVMRPAAELAFRGKAAYMERNGDYRVLWHRNWLQPLEEESRALPIIIDRSGDDASYPVLQGSVELQLSRFLHVTTNLWLNTDGSYLPDYWRMPAPPLAPPSVIIEEVPVLEELPPLNLARVPLAMPLPGEEQTRADTSGAENASGLEPDRETGAEPDVDAAPEYPYRHAVLLQQSRRMRSDEVHYLDHPLLGVVIRLTRLSEEELDQIARADAAAADAAAADAAAADAAAADAAAAGAAAQAE